MADELIAPTPRNVKYVDIGTHKLSYAETGGGPPIVFMHGGLMDHQSWGNQLSLQDSFRLILPDTRGHGRSGGANLPATYAAFADDVVALLDALDIETATLVGFSDGGCAALDAARRFPDVIQNLVLIGTPYNLRNYNPGILDRFRSISSEELIEAGSPVLKEEIAKMRVHMSDTQWKAYWNRIMKGLWVSEPNFELSDFAEMTVPTLILHGENEQYFARKNSEDLASTIPDAQLVYVPGTSHSAAQENPVFVNGAIRTFLNTRGQR